MSADTNNNSGSSRSFEMFISPTFEGLAVASNFSTCQLKHIRAEGGTGVIVVGHVSLWNITEENQVKKVSFPNRN